MKASIKFITVAVILIGFVAIPASAIMVLHDNLSRDISSAVGVGTNVQAQANGDTKPGQI